MVKINYEAWYKEEQIYNGTSRAELVKELHDYRSNERESPLLQVRDESE